MAKKKGKPAKFSVTKAVKANARERVGQPKPSRILDDQPREKRRTGKHRETLGKLLLKQESIDSD
jgi:hypothetical protein